MTAIKLPKVRILIKGGYGSIDVDTTETFVFGVFVQSIRANGYFVNDICYIPHDAIECIFQFDPANMDMMPVKAPTHGTPETKQ